MPTTEALSTLCIRDEGQIAYVEWPQEMERDCFLQTMLKAGKVAAAAYVDVNAGAARETADERLTLLLRHVSNAVHISRRLRQTLLVAKEVKRCDPVLHDELSRINQKLADAQLKMVMDLRNNFRLNPEVFEPVLTAMENAAGAFPSPQALAAILDRLHDRCQSQEVSPAYRVEAGEIAHRMTAALIRSAEVRERMAALLEAEVGNALQPV